MPPVLKPRVESTANLKDLGPVKSMTVLIAMFIPSLAGGGAEKMTLHLAGEFIRLGYRVDLLLVRNQGEHQSIIPGGVKVVTLGPRSLAACLLPLVYYLRERRPAVLVSSLTLTNCVSIFSRLLARCPTRVVISERNHLTQATTSTNRPLLRLLPSLARLLYPKADAVVCISNGVSADLRRIAPGIKPTDLHTIYNPATTDEQLAFQPPEKMPHPWLQLKSKPVILSVGRLVPQKDFKTLLNGFSILRSRRLARLVILGEGPARAELLEIAQSFGVAEDVLFPGFVPQPMAWFAGADAFALTSAWEGFGNVLVEALIAGLPIVATDCQSGPAEILDNGRFGALVPVGNELALADALDAALSEPRDKYRLRRRAMDFHVSTVATKYLRVMLNK